MIFDHLSHQARHGSARASDEIDDLFPMSLVIESPPNSFDLTTGP